MPTNSVVLSGSGSDQDGTISKYTWAQLNGPNSANFSPNNTVQNPTLTGLIQGTYTFALTTTDNVSASSKPDTVIVTTNGANSGITFTLINSTTDKDIQILKEGDIINIASLPTNKFNIRANTTPATVGSVVLNLSGTLTRKQTETGAPYALFGDNTGNYADWTPSIGYYTIKATPYTQANGGGTAGTSLTLNFQVINQVSIVTSKKMSGNNLSLTLVNPENNHDIQTFYDGSVINLATVGAKKLNIRVNTNTINSKSFELISTNLTVASNYYLLKNSTFYNWTPKVGQYTLKANAIRNRYGGVEKEAVPILNFKVINNPENVILNSTTTEIRTLKAFPNPSYVGRFTVMLPKQIQGEVSYSLVSMSGARLANGKLSLQKPTLILEFDFVKQMLHSGAYFLYLDSKEINGKCQLIKIE